MMRKLKVILVLILQISCLAFVVITASGDFGFSINNLKNFDFWSKLFITTVCSISSYICAQSLRHDVNIHTPSFVEKETTIQEVVSKTGVDFTDFLIYYNHEKKKRMYIAKKNAKIAKIRTKADHLREKGTFLSERQSQRLAAYEGKISAMRKHVTPEYVEKNIDILKVKFKRIKRAQILGVERREKTTETEIESAAKYYALTGTRRMMLGTTMSIIMAMLTYDVVFGVRTSAIVTIVTHLFTIGSAIYLGISTADKVYTGILVVNQVERIGILKSYDEWRKNRHEQETKNNAEYSESYLAEAKKFATDKNAAFGDDSLVGISFSPEIMHNTIMP